MSRPDVDEDALIRAALDARGRAYAPYSGFRVGAALLSRSGRLFTGCNVENAAYGLSNCAERTALFCAIASGCRPGEITHLAVVADTESPVAPCGACRQVMIELGGGGLLVIQANLQGKICRSLAQDLLPGAFSLGRESTIARDNS
jgi:cytidine deaminase